MTFQAYDLVWHPDHGWGTYLGRVDEPGHATVAYGNEPVDMRTVDVDRLRAHDAEDIPHDQTIDVVGHAEGYRVGPDGVDPVGNPAGYNRPDLLAHTQYRQAASQGRTRRIDDQLAAGTHHIQGGRS